jgi:hypothetical protein
LVSIGRSNKRRASLADTMCRYDFGILYYQTEHLTRFIPIDSSLQMIRKTKEKQR